MCFLASLKVFTTPHSSIRVRCYIYIDDGMFELTCPIELFYQTVEELTIVTCKIDVFPGSII
jgi:hypothetical protein